MWFDDFTTSIGKLTLAADASGLRHVLFENNKYDARGRESWKRDWTATRTAREQLEEYFAGERREFELELNPTGTEFQRATWFALAGIPFGATCSYGELARNLGSPKAVRGGRGEWPQPASYRPALSPGDRQRRQPYRLRRRVAPEAMVARA
jgi:methylated-DNA-[protein]-cysteine S-methyltransferase